jgi:hypothetical protein
LMFAAEIGDGLHWRRRGESEEQGVRTRHEVRGGRDVSTNLPRGCVVQRGPGRKSLAATEELYRILAASIIVIDEIKSKPTATSAFLDDAVYSRRPLARLEPSPRPLRRRVRFRERVGILTKRSGSQSRAQGGGVLNKRSDRKRLRQAASGPRGPRNQHGYNH